MIFAELALTGIVFGMLYATIHIDKLLPNRES